VINAFLGRRVLVTGATGFIGGALARRLRDLGAEVHGASRREIQKQPPCQHWWRADLGEISEARRLLADARPEIVFHLAGLASGARELAGVLPMLRANLLAVVNLLVAATEQRLGRLVLAGSLEEPAVHDVATAPHSPYTAAKLGARAYARMCHALYGTPVVCPRLFMVYGPGQPDVNKLIPYVTLSLLRDEPPALSSGSRPVDWIYIDDVVDALLAAGMAEGVEGRTLDVGSGRLVSVRQVVRQIERLVDTKVQARFGAVQERALEQVRVADVGPTAAYLGWRPRMPLEEGLRLTVDWYRSHEVAAVGAQSKGGAR